MDTSKLEGVQSAEGQEAKKAEGVSGEVALNEEVKKTGELNAELLSGYADALSSDLENMNGEDVFGSESIDDFAEKVGDRLADALGIDLDDEEWTKKLAEAIKVQGDSVTLMGVPIAEGYKFNTANAGTEDESAYRNLNEANPENLKKALKAFLEANPLPKE